MTNLIEAILLGVVQGVTEFLPVSSSGHLIIAREVLGISSDKFGLSFDVALHSGTLIAVLIFFRTALASLTLAWLSSVKERDWALTPDSKLAWLTLVGTIPAGLAGLLLEATLEDAVRSPETVAVMLILFCLPMVLAERLANRQRTLNALKGADAIVIGLLQAVALVPGVSRSGITISGGLLMGLRREDAASFAFLIAIPVIIAATAKHSIDLVSGEAGAGGDPLIVAAGLLTAGVVGYVSIAGLMRFLRTNTLLGFVAYRVALGSALIAFL